MANLFPTGYTSDLPIGGSDEKTDTKIGYKPGISFDYNTGDFVRDGKNRVVGSSGLESWWSWCVNCLQTERYAHLAYSTDFGIEKEAIFNAKSRAEAESILTRQISEALLADPYERTDYVEVLYIEWIEPSSVFVFARVHGIADASIDIQTYITRG